MATRSRVSKTEVIESLQTAVHRTHRLLFRLEEGLCGDFGVTPGQRRLLDRLARDGDRTVPELAREEGVSRQHVQVQVNHLMEHGFVRSRPNEAHRRSNLMQATASGKRILNKIRDRERSVFQEMSGFSKSASPATDTLERFSSALEDYLTEEA